MTVSTPKILGGCRSGRDSQGLARITYRMRHYETGASFEWYSCHPCACGSEEGVDNTGSDKNAGCRQQIVFVMTLLQ